MAVNSTTPAFTGMSSSITVILRVRRAYELYCTCGDSGLNDAATQGMALRATKEDWSTEEARDMAEDDEEDE